jgi:hypothetical protein
VGSTSTGRFTDYPGSRARPAQQSTGGGRAEGAGGGDDRCARAIQEQLLEEVPRCSYYERTGDVPPLGTDIVLVSRLVGGRLAVATLADEEVIGLLPTRLNYLLACMEAGWRYAGEVIEMRSAPLNVVRVELRPQQ